MDRSIRKCLEWIDEEVCVSKPDLKQATLGQIERYEVMRAICLWLDKSYTLSTEVKRYFGDETPEVLQKNGLDADANLLEIAQSMFADEPII